MKDKPWTRREDETSKAFRAFKIYLHMGWRNRSLRKVHDEVYGPESGNVRYVEKWSSKYDWVDRSDAYDRHLEEKRHRKHEKEMTAGLSNAAVRVRKLKKLHDRLEEEIFEHENYWLEDIKMNPGGENIHLLKYNGQLIRDYQRVLQDLAAEVGGRQNKVDVTTQGNPLQRNIQVSITDQGEDPEVEG